MERELELIKTINEKIFLYINNIFGHPNFDNLMIFVQKSLSASFAIFYLIIFAFYFSLLLRLKSNNEANFKGFFILGSSCLATFFCSSISTVIAVVLKNYVQVMRPFCASNGIYYLNEVVSKLNCSQSFPSGHMTAAIMIVASFWPLFNKTLKLFSVGFVITVGIGRIAAGAHYPLDLFGAIIITLPLILYIRPHIYNLVHKLDKKLKLSHFFWINFKKSKD